MQWLIDIVKEWIQAQGYLLSSFVDRGDPHLPDYTLDDVSVDGSWHELDISEIVPTAAKAVLFTSYLRTDSLDGFFKIRRHGNSDEQNSSTLLTEAANVLNWADLASPIDTDRKIDYQFPSFYLATVTDFKLVIKGWWL